MLARHKGGGREGRNEKRCTVKTGNILTILLCGECLLARHRTSTNGGARRYPHKICSVLLQIMKMN